MTETNPTREQLRLEGFELIDETLSFLVGCLGDALKSLGEDELLPFRLQLVLASRLAGIGAPVDGVSTAIADEDRLRVDVQRARRLGFAGKLCIHPQQVALVNRWLAPSAGELSWARQVLAAAAASGGAVVAVDGKMVDKPVLLRAEALLREA